MSFGCSRARACFASAKPTARAPLEAKTLRARRAQRSRRRTTALGGRATLAGCALVTGMPQQELPFVELFWAELRNPVFGHLQHAGRHLGDHLAIMRHE